jgi:hypothetical protein
MKCTSGPTCPCDFCAELRTGPSARDEDDQLATTYIESLKAFFWQGQMKDFTLTEQEWQHALCEWKAANWPRCLHDNYFDDCSTCLTHYQMTDEIQ